MTALPDSAFVQPHDVIGPVGTVLTGTEFLDLWTPAEVSAAMGADPVLMFNALRAISMNAVNLSSPTLLALLDRAVAKGVLSRVRADQIAAGTPPT